MSAGAIARTIGGALVAIALAISAGVFLESRTTSRALRELPPPGALVDIGGRVLHVWCEGEGSPVIVLEASGPGGARDWTKVMERVRGRTRVCAIDRAGMGWSDPGPLPRTAARITEDARAALGKLGEPAPYELGGASFGGLIVRHWALSYPDEVSGLVLVDAAHEAIVTAGADTFARLERILLGARLLARVGLLRLLDPFRIAGPEAALAYRADAWQALHSMIAARAQSVAELPVPGRYRAGLPVVMLVHGRAGDLLGAGFDDDAERFESQWQEIQAELARESGADLRVVPDCGHLIHIERPDAVAAALDDVADRAN